MAVDESKSPHLIHCPNEGGYLASQRNRRELEREGSVVFKAGGRGQTEVYACLAQRVKKRYQDIF